MPPSSKGIFHDLKATYHLSLPLMAAYAGNHFMGLVDTAVVGRLGAIELAGTGLGGSLFFLVSLLGFGLLHGLDPLASQAIGAEKPETARRHLREALVLSVIIVIPITLLIFSTLLTLPLLKIDTPTQNTAFSYLIGRTPSLLFLYFYLAIRGYLQALSITRPILVSSLIANLFNVPTTMFLTLGDKGLLLLGIPPIGFNGWGVFGAACATSLSTTLQMFILWWVLRKIPVPQNTGGPTQKGTRRIVELGYPVSFQMLAEGGMFAIGTVLMAKFGPSIMGGHQVAMQVATFTYSLCLGVASATSVRVGYAVGREDPIGTRKAGFSGVLAGLSIMFCSAFCLVFWARPIAMLFAKPPDVITAAIPFLYFASVFQLFDGTQTVLAGALRGAGETKLSMRVNILCHWGFSMPLGIYLAFFSPVRSYGIWCGFTLGLIAVSIVLTWSFHSYTQHQIKPV